MSQTGNMHEYGESNIRLIEPDESMEKRAEEECQQVLADYESDGMEEPQTRIIRNHPLSKYECTGLSMKSFNFKNNPIDPQLIRKIQRMIIAIKEREAKESAADQTNHEPSHNQTSEQFSDSNKGELVINPTPESELKPNSVEFPKDEHLNIHHINGMSTEHNFPIEPVNATKALSVDEYEKIVDNEDDIMDRITKLIRRDKTKIAKIRRILLESLDDDANESKIEGNLLELNPTNKNDTLTYDTSVFEESKSQLISENFIEQLEVDVAHGNVQKPYMPLPTKPTQDSTHFANTDETNLDSITIIRKNLEDYIEVKRKYRMDIEVRIRRIKNELRDLEKDSLSDYSIKPVSEYHWKATIRGPPGSVYEGGLFSLSIDIPKKYPYKAPKITFNTRVYHPNINRHGRVSMDILYAKWSPVLSISKVLLSICSLLTDPNANVPLDSKIAHVYKTDRDLFEKNAKYWTNKYAK